VTYLWMVAGADDHVKPDRMVLRWLAAKLGRPVDVVSARRLLAETARAVGCTPWELDTRSGGRAFSPGPPLRDIDLHPRLYPRTGGH
jgi:hypothetical protein